MVNSLCLMFGSNVTFVLTPFVLSCTSFVLISHSLAQWCGASGIKTLMTLAKYSWPYWLLLWLTNVIMHLNTLSQCKSYALCIAPSYIIASLVGLFLLYQMKFDSKFTSLTCFPKPNCSHCQTIIWLLYELILF